MKSQDCAVITLWSSDKDYIRAGRKGWRKEGQKEGGGQGGRIGARKLL